MSYPPTSSCVCGWRGYRKSGEFWRCTNCNRIDGGSAPLFRLDPPKDRPKKIVEFSTPCPTPESEARTRRLIEGAAQDLDTIIFNELANQASDNPVAVIRVDRETLGRLEAVGDKLAIGAITPEELREILYGTGTNEPKGLIARPPCDG